MGRGRQWRASVSLARWESRFWNTRRCARRSMGGSLLLASSLVIRMALGRELGSEGILRGRLNVREKDHCEVMTCNLAAKI